MPKGIAFNFLDVGMGDGTLIQMPPSDNGDIALVLVDFGEKGSPFKVASQDAIKFLIKRISKICRDMGYTYPFIDHLFITHADLDHWNKLGDLIDGVSGGEDNLWFKLGEWDDNERLEINRVTIGGNWNSYRIKDESVANKILNAVKDKNGFNGLPPDCHYDPKEQQNPVWRYGGANIILLSSNTGISINQTSLVLMFEYKDYKVILTGDADSFVERKIIGYYSMYPGFLNSFGLKLGHHGSKESTCKEWIDAVLPKAIFASGDRKWGHPYCLPIESVIKKGTLGKMHGTHWYVCSRSGAENDYCNYSTDLDICNNLWYVVTDPAGEKRLDDDGMEHEEGWGVYNGVQWELEIGLGADPVIKRTNAWPAPDPNITPRPCPP